jgi:YebC/PmpR family DNA-binding regulatory protein
MSGHSKWATIKHKKGATDAKRGKLFTKLIKELNVAARMCGGDPTKNPRLRKAISDARGESMPNDTINRAVKRGAGELEGESFEELLYEGSGPAGALYIVEVLTDNKNRSAAEIRKVFEKGGGALGGAGAAAWAFDRRGLIQIKKESATEDQLMEIGIGGGAEDYTDLGDIWLLATPPEALSIVLDALEAGKIPVKTSQLGYLPKIKKALTGKDASQAIALAEYLDDHDDVQNVYADFDVADDELAKLE